MADEVDQTAGHLRMLIERVRIFDASKSMEDKLKMFDQADKAEKFLNRVED